MLRLQSHRNLWSGIALHTSNSRFRSAHKSFTILRALNCWHRWTFPCRFFRHVCNIPLQLFRGIQPKLMQKATSQCQTILRLSSGHIVRHGEFLLKYVSSIGKGCFLKCLPKKGRHGGLCQHGLGRHATKRYTNILNEPTRIILIGSELDSHSGSHNTNIVFPPPSLFERHAVLQPRCQQGNVDTFDHFHFGFLHFTIAHEEVGDGNVPSTQGSIRTGTRCQNQRRIERR
mmetsp:Transcript_20911/g.44084  ORF Transcript_20911/g.44084 Transcript_20911/m.44084 type:complete len:230 (+) Transcript_20911:2775-3464(+)